ncbi:MAG: hypothetical protein SLAVMIC_01026 [uncultured marine phage]|uniref:Uncharacterized protein n=1 Tax=uncultured marine phage TaxID=707152 RepID=A0A8D9CE08_9VIRU|nr:MAG: hypothetical protein SLAVMIC_01026 [uncultured marine phage]
MESLKWHTINGNRVFLNSFRSRIKSIGYEFIRDILDFDRKWFHTKDPNGYKYKFDIEQYDEKEFNTKQFYKEFIDCIRPHLSKSQFRDLRLASIGCDIYNREKLQKIFLYGNS